jgi:short-subunit dehydrogenase
MEISNRHVLVTGAGRGIGRAFARICAESEAHLHLVMRTSDAELEALLLKEGAKSVRIWIADLTKREHIEQLIQDLNDTPIDILFNNAGVLSGGYLEEQDLSDIYNMMQVNVGALIHLTRGVLPGMISRKRGKVINNSSVMAYMHLPFASTYSASKAAVAAFTQCLEQELKSTEVSTLLLVTPPVRTRMLEEVEDLYSKSIKLPYSSISPHQYAGMIRDAILHDLKSLEPSGLMGVTFKLAKFAAPLFGKEVKRRFRRDS